MPNVAELITEHVTLTVDCVDRLVTAYTGCKCEKA